MTDKVWLIKVVARLYYREDLLSKIELLDESIEVFQYHGSLDAALDILVRYKERFNEVSSSTLEYTIDSITELPADTGLYDLKKLGVSSLGEEMIEALE